MPNFADSNRTILRAIKEVQWGQTPSSGTTRTVRLNSHTMKTTKNTTTSNELRADRMVSAIIETEAMADGGISAEFSAGSYDEFLEAFVAGAWTRPMTHDFWKGTTLSWVANNKLRIAGVDVTDYLTVGRRMKTEGWKVPANNGFRQIGSVAYTGGNTDITFTTTTATAEVGTAYAKVMDANDVIVLNNTSIRAGTAGASSFDSNGTNAFAAAISAGQIVPGMKIYVDGLGYETGTFAFTAVAVSGSICIVNDGENSFMFVAGTDFAVGSTATDSATNLAAAINAARVVGVGGGAGVAPTFLNVTATSSTGTVTVRNLNVTGGTLSDANDGGGNITVVNFSGGNETVRGVFTITSALDDVLYVSPAPATNANAGSIPVTIRGSMLRNPGDPDDIVTQSFSLEAGYVDVSTFFLMDGQRVGSFTLDANAGQIVTVGFEFQGRATTTDNATTLGDAGNYNPLEATETEPLNATSNVGTVLKNGFEVTTAIKQIKLDGKAQLRNQMALGSKFPVGIGTGRFELTGSIQAYFASLELFNNFLDHDTLSLSFPFEDLDGNVYHFTVPALKLTADPISPGGIDQDVMEEITFSAFRDPATACMFQVDRFSSIRPF